MKRFFVLIICALLGIGLLGCAAVQVTESSSSANPSENIPPASIPVNEPYIVFSPYAINSNSKIEVGEDYELYCTLVDSVINYSEKVSGFESEEQFHKLWCIMRNEFLPAQMLCANFTTTDTPYVYMDGTVQLEFLFARDEHMGILDAYTQCIQKDLSLLSEDDTEVEMIAKLYKRVSEEMIYDDCQMELYDCIIQKRGVCDQFARYLMILLNQLNVECYYAYSNGEGVVYHAWVVAKMNEHYYHFDPTWEQAYKNWFWFAIDDELRKDSLVVEWQTVYMMGGNLDAINGDHVRIGGRRFITNNQEILPPTCPEAYKELDRQDGKDPWLW